MARESKITYEERNRIDDQLQNCHYYFTTTLSGIFYLAYVDNDYPEYLNTQFFDDIQKEGLNLLLDDKGELNKAAREKLKTLGERYRMPKNASSISAAKAELDQVHIEMKKNVNNIVNNLEDINVLEHKSKKLEEGADIMRRDAKDLESTTWWRNVKLTIIIIVIVIALLLVIILPLTLGGSSNDEKKKYKYNKYYPRKHDKILHIILFSRYNKYIDFYNI